jgi:hypothetical protein
MKKLRHSGLDAESIGAGLDSGIRRNDGVFFCIDVIAP